MNRKDLIAKIRKCLALARSANEHESAAALAMAAKLAAEAGIDLETVEVEQHASRASRTQRPPAWESYLSAAVARALNCVKYYDATGDMAFVGRGANPEIAAYAFTALRRQLLAARKEHIATVLRRCRPGRKRQRADAYCEGWASAVYSKIAALAPKVAPDEMVDRWLSEHVPSLSKIVARRSGAKGAAADRDYWRGYDRGSEAELNPAMGQQTTALLG